jgi:hypothetical protein
MVACADWHYKQADRWLNQVYVHARTPLDKQGRKLLLDAQRSWLAFRDAECVNARDAARGGTMASILQISCLTDLTKKRARDLTASPNSLVASSIPLAFEKAGKSILGSFKCDDQLMEARIGLLPVSPPDKSTLRAQLVVGQHALTWPIGGNQQDAFCGADISLSIVAGKGNCHAISVNDGLCDAFFVNWDDRTRKFLWSRN